MRTGRYYYNMMSKDLKAKFKSNYIAAKKAIPFSEYLDTEVNSLWLFLSKAFLWVNTPEGVQFWTDLAAQEVFRNPAQDVLVTITEAPKTPNQETRRLKIACAVMAVGYVVTLSIFIYHLIAK